ncbi:MAG: site-specific DNA-methyltransferase [Thermodesulfobacteriota bacterium]|nr:MAG: site-specific DNA-methyltransferase [Thermodesulfobacteriota bacterium]
MTLMEELKELLKEDTRFVDSEGNLLKNRIVELALKLDENLIKLLLQNDRIKQHFFKDIDGVLVFDKEKFMKFIDNKEFLPDSYTAFKNKIGLANEEGKYLAKSKEVVLVWPYKDCVLEGGQEKPDEKRKEIFHNVILAPDEIDRLLEPKVFTNFKRIDKDGEHPLDGFRRDPEINKKRGLPEDTITDNLIIKGNNLLVLHSLLKEFRGKVKLIYIDPPYNTGNDEFQYNDSFNHSTWLTFMRNRLEVAKKLLREDGAIFVQCDDNEQAYLKVLMDEIFGRENFVNCIAVKMAELTGVKMSHVRKRLPKIKEYLLVYKKEQAVFNPAKIPKQEWDNEYKIFIDNINQEDIALLKEIMKKEDRTKEDINRADEICKKFEFISISEAMKKYNVQENEWENWRFKNSWRIVRTVATVESVKKLADSKKRALNQPAFSIVTPENRMYIIKSDYDETRDQPRIKILFADDYLSVTLGDFWQDIKTTGLDPEGGVKLTKGKKPEQLIKRIIDMCTQSKDIILDFFMGTGTTCAVAHKMERQYIGVEQLNYEENSAVVRLKNVINGDQTGISKEVGWQGGGDFVYMELMKLNEAFVERIRDAETTEEILSIWEEMKHNGFLSYRVDPRLFDENIEEFKALTLDEQKRLLLEMLDYNDLYVNYSEIDDAIYNVSEEDRKLNKEFCEGK